MKTIKYFSIISIAILISSCSITQKVSKSIVGKWQITALESDGENQLSDSFNKTISGLLADSYIEFKQDKTYELSLAGKKLNGNWSISEDGKKILSSEEENFFEIMQSSENTMTLKSVKSAKRMIMILSRIQPAMP